jgi:hypothetical protein
LEDAYREEIPEPSADVIPARFVLADTEEAVEPLRAEREGREGRNEHKEKGNIGRFHAVKVGLEKALNHGEHGVYRGNEN